MPLTGDAKRKYQAELMAKKRAEAAEHEVHREAARTGEVPIAKAKGRNEFGELVLRPGDYVPGEHEHYWGWVSKAEDGTRVCLEFEYQGRMIGGCGQVMAWEGKPLNTFTDGLPDSAHLIRDSETAPAIQKRMPVTAKRS